MSVSLRGVSVVFPFNFFYTLCFVHATFLSCMQVLYNNLTPYTPLLSPLEICKVLYFCFLSFKFCQFSKSISTVIFLSMCLSTYSCFWTLFLCSARIIALQLSRRYAFCNCGYPGEPTENMNGVI